MGDDGDEQNRFHQAGSLSVEANAGDGERTVRRGGAPVEIGAQDEDTTVADIHDDEESDDKDEVPMLLNAGEEKKPEQVETVQERLERLGASDDNALINAVMRADVDDVKFLLLHGLSLHNTNELGQRALSIAAASSHVEVVRVLIEHEADMEATDNLGRTALSYAAGEGHAEVLQLLMRFGANVEAKSSDRRTALSYAAERGRVEAARELVRLGAHVDTRLAFGRTALWYATKNGNAELVQDLIRLGADIEGEDDDKQTALSLAAKMGHAEVVQALTSLGADVEAADEDGKTALLYAAEEGHGQVVRTLINHKADVEFVDNSGRTALSYAAEWGHVEVVRQLLRSNADVQAMDYEGRTSLSYAAEKGHAALVQELIKHGADIEAKDNNKRTALSYAAENDRVAVVQALAEHGADAKTKDCDGKTALSYAAGKGYVETTEELIRVGAEINAQDSDGQTALLYAVEKGHVVLAHKLLTFGADVNITGTDGRTALWSAAARRYTGLLEQLIGRKAFVDAAAIDGRTPLLYAAEHNHADVARILIKHGAFLDAALDSSSSHRGSETSLVVAGRAGHLKIFQDLVQAGASVNVQSRKDGETPLISAARWDFFAGVQLLMTHGGRLHHQDVSEYEVPLIPGTLEKMEHLCIGALEFKPMCSCLVERLLDICALLQQPGATDATKSTLVSFASIVFRVCTLLLEIGKRESPLSRLTGSRAITNRIQDFHEELGHFARLLSLPPGGDNWKSHSTEAQTLLLSRLEEQLNTDEALLNECGYEAARVETAVLLPYELRARAQDGHRPELQKALQRVLTRFLRVCEIEVAPAVPEWFISPDDVNFHSWNLIRTVGDIEFYEGKWRKTDVMIEISDNAYGDEFENIAFQWFRLNHPNVVKFFGANHIKSPRSPRFFVYELEPKGSRLQEFLRIDSNRALTWKCLHEAALGLQHLHSRGICHGFLRSESFIFSSEITKLCGLRHVDTPYKHGKRSGLNWRSPEQLLLRDKWRNALTWGSPEQILSDSPSAVFGASDIYAFGMCIWEALTLELPWKDASVNKVDIETSVRRGKLPERPERFRDAEWNLITKMCAANPSERVKITLVVGQLKQFALDEGGNNVRFTASGVSEVRVHALCASAETNAVSQTPMRVKNQTTVHMAAKLRSIQSKCGRLPKDQWLVRTVCPALEVIFTLLQERQNSTLTDVEVARFIDVLTRVRRYLRRPRTEKSAYQLARSCKVAESHHVIYSELDCVLDMLSISESDPIRAWRSQGSEVEQVTQTDSNTSASDVQDANESSSAVTVNHIDSSSSNHHHEDWTWAGLATRKTMPSWHISLRDILFGESDEIGRGAFGAVYKGTWKDTRVVIKFMGYEEDIGTISTDLLLHEVRVWHRLNHPHVLKLYGAYHRDKRYFVCEFAPNGELTKYLKKPGNDHLIWQKLHEAALGLQYLHEMNVTHNDLKGDNIMVGMNGNVKLIDFGLSCLLDEAEIQIDIKKIGAANWRSLEYLTGERPSFASDVYSFAMCIVEVVSGDIPWGHPMVPAQVRFQLKKGHMPDLPDWANEKQRDLIQLMAKADPSKRVKIGYVVDKLNEIAQDERANMAL